MLLNFRTGKSEQNSVDQDQTAGYTLIAIPSALFGLKF